MLLLTLIHNGKLMRCSMKDERLEHQWSGVVQAIDAIRIGAKKQYGGWLQAAMPSITFSPDLWKTFSENFSSYPPPRQMWGKIEWSATTEAEAVEICKGVLTRKTVKDTGFVYQLQEYPYLPFPAPGQTLAVQYSYRGTDWHSTWESGDCFLRASLDGGATWGSAVQILIPAGTSLATIGAASNFITGFMTRICEMCGLTLDSTLAAEDNAVTGRISSAMSPLDAADAVCPYFGHYFRIVGGVLHLIDNDLQIGDPLDFGTEGFLKSPDYANDLPVNRVFDSEGKYIFVGSTIGGVDFDAGQSWFAEDERYLSKIADVVEEARYRLSAMGQDGVELLTGFQFGREIRWTDTRHIRPFRAKMFARELTIEFGALTDKVTVVGEALHVRESVAGIAVQAAMRLTGTNLAGLSVQVGMRYVPVMVEAISVQAGVRLSNTALVGISVQAGVRLSNTALVGISVQVGMRKIS